MVGKKFLIALAIVAVLGGGMASSTSALTIEEIQVQIQQLIGQLSAMTGTPIQEQSSVSISPIPGVGKHRICNALTRNLSQGTRGDDVMSLQEFLRSEGHLTVSATGYFGPATRAAVARWQAQQGISSVGAVGPVSRERIKMWCGSVGGPIACTKEYQPVCGSKSIVCITTPCNPIQQTYSNRCMMEADGATFAYEGVCRDISPDPSTDPRCKAWYDGCNNCSRENPNSPAMCTLRACFQQAPAYCTAYFDSAPLNKPPTVSSFSGPTTLNVNQTGTWTVQASDPENGQLTYQIWWGDENVYAPTAGASAAREFVQTTTFTHTYNSTGTYTVTIIVRDSSGQEAKTTSTVRVGSQPVACTMDAMLCPNGTWIGRTGPNCEFVCPAY